MLIGTSLLILSQVGREWSSSEGFWRENINGEEGRRVVSSGWATSYTMGVLILIVLWSLGRATRLRSFFPSYHRFQFHVAASYPSSPINNCATTASSGLPLPLSQHQVSTIVSDSDLKLLIDNLDDHPFDDEKWENVVDRRSSLLSYCAKCCKPRDGPLKYMSVTVFEKVSVEMLRDFYMDNDYRKQWDRTLIEHEQLQVYEGNGTEIGRTIKKFPLLTAREYVLAWRLWEGKDGIFYCFSKECEHPLAPKLRKYVRVGFFRSGWRIRKVPGRNACEIMMLYQEDAGLNVEMAKLAFAKGIWSYVCKMDRALRKYSAISNSRLASFVSALTFIQKIPPELDAINSSTDPKITTPQAFSCQEVCESSEKKLSRRPSSKLIVNGLFLLGGAICLHHSHSNLGAKAAMACILVKLTKCRSSSGQTRQASIVK